MMSMCDACLQRQLEEGAASAAAEERIARERIGAIVLTTTESLDGFRVRRVIDVISTEYVFRPTVLADFATALFDVPVSGSRAETQTALAEGRKQCLTELRRAALGVGANAVVGVSLNVAEFTGRGNSMVMLTAVGTAVELEAVAPSA